MMPKARPRAVGTATRSPITGRRELATRPQAAGERAALDGHDLAHDPTDRFRLDLIHQSPRRHRSAEA